MNGSQVTENIINNIRKIIQDFYVDKGFLNVKINITEKVDPKMPNSVKLNAEVIKNKRVKIEDIIFEGNKIFPDKKLRRVMKKTKKKNWNIFKASKYIEDNMEEDRKSLRDFYNKNGYRDFKILKDSTYLVNNERIGLVLRIVEGDKYYIRNISWVGNTKFPSEYLSAILGIRKGEIGRAHV